VAQLKTTAHIMVLQHAMYTEFASEYISFSASQHILYMLLYLHMQTITLQHTTKQCQLYV